jgi:hypothetical protein
MDGRRGKWIAKILEFDLEINPTNLIKGQGLAKLLAKSNCKSLGINYINACSRIQQTDSPNKNSQGALSLAACTWCLHPFH